MYRSDSSAERAVPAPRVPRRLTFGTDPAAAPAASTAHRAAGAPAVPRPVEPRTARMLLINVMAALFVGALLGADTMLEMVGQRSGGRAPAEPSLMAGRQMPAGTEAGPASEVASAAPA